MSKYMRILVFFDLPVVKQSDRKMSTQFRRFLLKDGYDMLQFSVYSRICNGTDNVTKHINRLMDNLPSKGSIRCLPVTENQYASMKFLVGKPTAREKKVNVQQLSIF